MKKPMSEHTEASEDRPDDDDVEAGREDREEIGGGSAKEPPPWAITPSGDDD